jgi:sulfonate transport system substrate-binding protein
MSHTMRRLLGGLTLAALLGLAAACSSSGSPATGTAAQGGGGSSGLVIDLGDQQQYLQTALTESGALQGAGYTVNYVEFGSGPLVDAGFAAHRIDLGFMGDLPASLAGKSGLPVTVVAVNRPVGSAEYLLAEPGITSVTQLRGKPVAYTTGTAEQAFALRALKAAGLSQQDVKQVDVTLQQLGTVLESGAAVASVVSAEQKADYEQAHPNAVVLASLDTVSPPSYDYFLAANTALASPAKLAAIDDLLKRLIQASNWEKAHESQWTTDYYVKVEHQTPAVARLILGAGGTWTYVPVNGAVQDALQQLVGLMAGAGAGAGYSVAPLFNTPAETRFAAILKEVPQNG